MQVIRVNDVEKFDTQLQEALGLNANKVYIIFFGTEQDETNESWCPDCVIADPKIRKFVMQKENSVLIECPVGDRDAYKNKPQHPYRIHPEVQLKAIPQLFEWTKNGPKQTLIEEDCADDAKLEAFFA